MNATGIGALWRQFPLTTGLVALMLVVIFGDGDMFLKTKSDPSQALIEALQTIAEAYHSQDRPPPQKPPLGKHEYLAGLAKRLGDLIAKTPAECQPPLRYHQAWILAVSGGTSEAIKILDDLAKGSQFLPEALWLNIQISAAETDEKSNKRRWEIEDQLGARLPISSWGRLRDARLEEKEAERLGRTLPDAPGAIIPKLEGRKLIAIANLFSTMKLAEESAGACREAIYGGLTPPQYQEALPETWTSPEAAELWLAAASWDAALGRNGWAAQALAMAVCSSRQREKEALEMARSLFASKPSLPQPQPEAGKLKQIAAHYRDLNLHPRALAALDLAAKLPGTDVKALQAECSKSWEELLGKFVKGREPTRHLFGKKVSSAPPSQIVPSPFPFTELRNIK